MTGMIDEMLFKFKLQKSYRKRCLWVLLGLGMCVLPLLFVIDIWGRVTGGEVRVFVGMVDQSPIKGVVSDDGMHVALLLPAGNSNIPKQALFLDGKIIKEYEKIELMRFNPGGTSCIYIAQNMAGHHVLGINSDEIATGYEFGYLSFSVDRRWLKWSSREGGFNFDIFVENQNIGHDTKAVHRYDYYSSNSEAAFHESGCFVGSVDKDRFVVLKKERASRSMEGCNSDLVSSPIWSIDGKRVAYFVNRDKKEVVLLDGQEGCPYDFVRSFRFSRDAKRFAYIARKDGSMLVVHNGVEGDKYDGVFYLQFSDNNEHFAYGACKLKSNKRFIVKDGLAGKEYDAIGPPVFDLSGNHMAYRAKLGEDEFVVLDEEEGRRYCSVGDPVFSNDGRSLAYKASEMGTPFQRMVNNTIGNIYELKRHQFVVFNGKPLSEYSWVSDPVFSSDGTLIYYGLLENKLFRITYLSGEPT